jgi:hypothetical protein
MTTTEPFQIRNEATDETVALHDLDVFERDYEPNGFHILDVQPSGYTKPERKPKGKRKADDEKPEAQSPDKPAGQAKDKDAK